MSHSSRFNCNGTVLLLATGIAEETPTTSLWCVNGGRVQLQPILHQEGQFSRFLCDYIWTGVSLLCQCFVVYSGGMTTPEIKKQWSTGWGMGMAWSCAKNLHTVTKAQTNKLQSWLVEAGSTAPSVYSRTNLGEEKM